MCTIKSNCTLTFDIPFTMQSPVFFYYELNNFYQNHRLYAASVSKDQLAGNIIGYSDVNINNNTGKNAL